MHIRFRALDVVMQIVTEQLDVRDRRRRHIRPRKVTGEQYKGDMTRILRIPQACNMTDFKRWVSIGVKHLWRILNRGLPASINEFLIKR